MATALAAARGQHHCSQPTNLQSWFVHSHACSAVRLRCPAAIKVSAALSSTPVALSVGRRQLLAGFAALTAGASQVCRPVALATATSTVQSFLSNTQCSCMFAARAQPAANLGCRSPAKQHTSRPGLCLTGPISGGKASQD